jgi:hypothetical protein
MHLGRARLGLQICKQPKKDTNAFATNSRCKITQGHIHNQGTKKECLTKKGFQRIILDFYNI